jgi:hypothetical protein
MYCVKPSSKGGTRGQAFDIDGLYNFADGKGVAHHKAFSGEVEIRWF